MTQLNKRVGAVVIGRNEGVRLERCLHSLLAVLDVVVYVDSGSTDDSVSIAASLHVQVVRLDEAIRFTAGLARNAGFDRMRQFYPDLEFVQFVDGDCELVDGWLEAGISELDARMNVAVVCGRRREIFRQASLYNRLIDREWDTPIGDASSSGGDFLVRSACFQSSGGFNPDVVAGEEPELGYRLRRDGWRISRIDCDMTRHDAALTSASAWYRRERRAGYGGIDVLHRTPDDPVSYFRRQIRSAWFWTLGWHTALIIAALIGWLSTGGFGIAIGVAGWSLLTWTQMSRIAVKYRRHQNLLLDSYRMALITFLGKWPEVLGQLAWYRDRWLGRPALLIEYKSVPTAKSEAVSS